MNYKNCILHIKKECEYGGDSCCPCSQFCDCRIWDKKPSFDNLTVKEHEYYAKQHYDATHIEK